MRMYKHCHYSALHTLQNHAIRCSGGWQVPQAQDCLGANGPVRPFRVPCGARDRYRPQHAPERLPSCPGHFPHLSLSMSGPCSISSSLFSSPSFLKVPSPHGHLSLPAPAPTEVKQSPPSRLDPIPDLRRSSLHLLYLYRSLFLLISFISSPCHRRIAISFTLRPLDPTSGLLSFSLCLVIATQHRISDSTTSSSSLGSTRQ